MSKNFQALLGLLVLILGIIWSLYGSGPNVDLEEEIPQDQFSTARAFDHVEALSQEPHYVGSPAHRRVRNYIVSELEDLGLFVQTQEGYSLNARGVLTRPQNILARINGTGEGKALLIMSHYDSAMHSSPGASDAASGIATILEGLRAFKSSGRTPENDIIILFTDAEELGLNGADLFVKEHPWAEDIGLALNFESRGSGGNSFMLLETNDGNKGLLDHFTNAGVQFPVTNSLAYSVYKMLPNDTDLTVLREQSDINGFNFAFIDDHFDYHTATDTPENLDINTLAHQGSYLMPLLNYFSSIPLENLSSEEDVLFFTVPGFDLIMYPYSWIFPLLVISYLFFFLLIFLGKHKKRLSLMDVLKGFIPLGISLSLSGLIGYFFWKFMLFLYPGYGEMEHGFTYNGYWYIGAIVFLSLTICFYVYHRFRKPDNAHHLLVAPIFTWLIISTLAALYLKGAAYFIIPVIFALIQLGLLIFNGKWAPVAVALLGLPVVFILLPFIISFPVALGLKMLLLSSILTVLLFSLLWPIFSYFRNNQLFGFMSFIVFMVLLITAHFKSEFNKTRPRPNSLVYLFDEALDLATWNTYDKRFDSYTSPFFKDDAVESPEMHWFGSKNASPFTFSAIAPKIMVPKPFISVEGEEIDSGRISYEVKIASNRNLNRIELFADRSVDFLTFKVNGKEAENLQPGESDLHIFKNRWQDRLLTYYAANRDTLRLHITLPQGEHPEILLYEAAYDLHDNPQLAVPLRTSEMIPRPFVLNDAIVVKRVFNLR